MMSLIWSCQLNNCFNFTPKEQGLSRSNLACCGLVRHLESQQAWLPNSKTQALGKGKLTCGCKCGSRWNLQVLKATEASCGSKCGSSVRLQAQASRSGLKSLHFRIRKLETCISFDLLAQAPWWKKGAKMFWNLARNLERDLESKGIWKGGSGKGRSRWMQEKNKGEEECR